MMDVLESSIEKYLVSQCKTRGIPIRKVQWVGRRGCPDRLLLYEGGIFIELKRPKGGKFSPHQIREHKVLTDAGFKVLNISTKEEVDILIKSL